MQFGDELTPTLVKDPPAIAWFSEDSAYYTVAMVGKCVKFVNFFRLLIYKKKQKVFKERKHIRCKKFQCNSVFLMETYKNQIRIVRAVTIPSYARWCTGWYVTSPAVI